MKQTLFEHLIDYYLYNESIIGIIPSLDMVFTCKESEVYPTKILSSQKPLFHSSYSRKQRIKRVFVLTSACNLRCSYCFEGSEHKPENLDISTLKHCIKTMFEEAIQNNKKLISFSLFGGEPTMNWEAVETAIKTAQHLEQKTDVRCYKAIVTNGVMSYEHAKYLAENIDFIYFSFDGPKELFLQQRKPKGGADIYEIIFRNAQVVYKSNAYLSFKITVTSLTIDHLKEIDDFFAYHFPTCGRLYQSCMVEESDELYITFGDFLEKYYKLQKYSIFAKNMTTSLYKNKPSDRFCNLGIRNVIYPNGDVLACHRSNMCIPEDSVKQVFKIGHCENDGTIIRDHMKAQNMELFNVNQIPTCRECSLRYHCCGGCATVKLLSGNHDMFRKADYCEDFKKYAFTMICEKLFGLSNNDALIEIPPKLEFSESSMLETDFNTYIVEKMISIEEY